MRTHLTRTPRAQTQAPRLPAAAKPEAEVAAVMTVEAAAETRVAVHGSMEARSALWRTPPSFHDRECVNLNARPPGVPSQHSSK